MVRVPSCLFVLLFLIVRCVRTRPDFSKTSSLRSVQTSLMRAALNNAVANRQRYKVVCNPEVNNNWISCWVSIFPRPCRFRFNYHFPISLKNGLQQWGRVCPVGMTVITCIVLTLRVVSKWYHEGIKVIPSSSLVLPSRTRLPVSSYDGWS